MKLLLINGSPRYKKSNSELLAQEFIKGFNSAGCNNELCYLYLSKRSDLRDFECRLADTDSIICITPLYTDAMPGIVKEFLEKLYAYTLPEKLKLGFVIHSGFPESTHSLYLARYFKRYCQRIGCDYLGTIIKAGTEGMQMKHPRMNASLYGSFRNLGTRFAVDATFDSEIINKLAKPDKLSLYSIWLMKFLKAIGILDFYWKTNLKKYKAYQKRFDKPYV